METANENCRLGFLGLMNRKIKNRLSDRWVYYQESLRWPGLSILVGVAAGLGAVLFDELLKWSFHFFVQVPTGYAEPSRGAPVSEVLRLLHFPFSGLIILIPALGGLIAGLLVFTLAPEAEGHGTDGMIDAFHQRGGYIRKRVPLVKTLASAITIGSGGSAGKEGPIAQIGAGFGSILATLLNLKARDRRIMILAGAAGGIGAIFHAPLGAALFAPEVLYRDAEFEFEAILPCVTSSIIAYAIYIKIFGRAALFSPGPVDFYLIELVPYLFFGLVCALVGYLYVRFFYGSRDYFFRRLPVPRIFKPALGGLLLGLVLFFFPQVMDGGYGWIQAALEGKILWQTMLLLAFLKILATSLTISSGGSGGVFGPSVFIGAMLGGAFGFLGREISPAWVIHPHSFVLVGIGGFFAGVAKVPIASIIMACEMSGSYTLLVPLMLVSSISFLILGKTSLYEKQVSRRSWSPAHTGEFVSDLLDTMMVYEALRPRTVTLIPENLPFKDLLILLAEAPDTYFPVVNDQNQMTGIISVNDIRAVLFEDPETLPLIAKDAATQRVERVFWDDSLKTALEKMAGLQVDELPVVRQENPGEVLSIISKKDIVNHYYNRSRSI
jgi:chloride channel protein, CIC family